MTSEPQKLRIYIPDDGKSIEIGHGDSKVVMGSGEFLDRLGKFQELVPFLDDPSSKHEPVPTVCPSCGKRELIFDWEGDESVVRCLSCGFVCTGKTFEDALIDAEAEDPPVWNVAADIAMSLMIREAVRTIHKSFTTTIGPEGFRGTEEEYKTFLEALRTIESFSDGIRERALDRLEAMCDDH